MGTSVIGSTIKNKKKKKKAIGVITSQAVEARGQQVTRRRDKGLAKHKSAVDP